MPFPEPGDANADQIAYWNGPGGRRWLDRQQMQDNLLDPISCRLLDRADPRAGEIALDIGCGCGASSIELAQRVLPSGHVLGIDVSAPMLERARQRRPQGLPVDFILADATVYKFPSGRADLLYSRFGVMFFADPARSFTQMRLGLRKGARVVFSCWREARANPWLLLPLQEVYRHVPRLPEVCPQDPGPFSFADEHRVRNLLERAGYGSIRFEPVDLDLDLANGLGLEAAVDTAMEIGPASRALDDQPPELRHAARESIRAALAHCQAGNRVPLPAALWIVRADNVG